MKEYKTLVDFDRLLSHHDKKLADRLNNEYLAEEWDFGHETLTKGKFKEPPVVCGESRSQMAREQKLKYRYLKSELINSHRKMYRAKAGYIRDRPITAPDLSMYVEEEAIPPPQEFTAHDAYEIVQRKVKSANAALGRTRPDLSDKPDIPKPQKVWSAQAVSEEELEDTKKRYDVLKFDIETVQGRFEYQKEKEIEYYFPGQLERLTKQQEEKEENEGTEMKKSSQTSKPKLTQKEVNRLAYPPSHLPPSHAKACDARFRGWHNVKKKKGSHFVLVAPSFENSYNGRLHKKLVETSNVPVKKIKGDFVHRFTKKTDVPKSVDNNMRPSTAPANLELSDSETENEALVGVTESPADSYKTADTGYGSMEDKLGEGSSAESLVKSPDLQNVKTLEDTTVPKVGCPKSFESTKSKEKEAKHSSVISFKDGKDIKDTTNSQKQYLASFSRAKTDISLEAKNNSDLENVSKDKRPKSSNYTYSDNSKFSSSPKDSSIKNSNKNGFHKNIQTVNHANGNSENKEKPVDLNTKVENYKKDLKKYTLEKRASNSQRSSVKSPPALQFTFTSVLNDSDDDDLDNYVPIAIKSNKVISFNDEILSPDLVSPRTPEPTVYTKPKKEVIDIENLPVPQLQHSKPKTVSVGAIGKISLLESITESRFWEDVIEESHKKQKLEEVFISEEENINPKEKELVNLKEEEFDDDSSTYSELSSDNVNTKPKPKREKKQYLPAQNIDDKLMKAKMDRLKRQKRVIKRTSSFEKMGLTPTRNNRASRTSSSSETSQKEQDVLHKEQSPRRRSSLDSKTKQKNEKNKAQQNVMVEITKTDNQKPKKGDEKQKMFCDSMKRLVIRMDGSLSGDMRTKMLKTRLS